MLAHPTIQQRYNTTFRVNILQVPSLPLQCIYMFPEKTQAAWKEDAQGFFLNTLLEKQTRIVSEIKSVYKENTKNRGEPARKWVATVQIYTAPGTGLCKYNSHPAMEGGREGGREERRKEKEEGGREGTHRVTQLPPTPPSLIKQLSSAFCSKASRALSLRAPHIAFLHLDLSVSVCLIWNQAALRLSFLVKKMGLRYPGR